MALGWLWGAYQLAINTLWGGSDVALKSHWGGFVRLGSLLHHSSFILLPSPQALQFDLLPRQGHRRRRCRAGPAASDPASSALEAELIELPQRPPVALPQSRGEQGIVRQPVPPIGGLATSRPAIDWVPGEPACKAELS